MAAETTPPAKPDPVAADLRDALIEWRRRNGLPAGAELRYLGRFLADRIDLASYLDALGELPETRQPAEAKPEAPRRGR